MNIFKNCFLILMVSSSLLLSSCDKISAQEYTKEENISADFSATESGSVAERKAQENDKASLDITEITTIEPPEDGWTLEQLNEVMYLNNEHLYLPCTLEDLNKKFEIQNNFPYQNEKEKSLTYDVLLNSDYVFGINCKNDKTKKITAIAISQKMISSNIESNDLLIVNGFGLGDNIEELINTLGKPTSETEISYSYTIKDANINIIFVFSNLEKVTSIIIEDLEE